MDKATGTFVYRCISAVVHFVAPPQFFLFQLKHPYIHSQNTPLMWHSLYYYAWRWDPSILPKGIWLVAYWDNQQNILEIIWCLSKSCRGMYIHGTGENPNWFWRYKTIGMVVLYRIKKSKNNPVSSLCVNMPNVMTRTWFSHYYHSIIEDQCSIIKLISSLNNWFVIAHNTLCCLLSYLK